MIFHENRLLADNSHVISCFYFFLKIRKNLQNLLSAAVVIGALRIINLQKMTRNDSILDLVNINVYIKSVEILSICFQDIEWE